MQRRKTGFADMLKAAAQTVKVEANTVSAFTDGIDGDEVYGSGCGGDGCGGGNNSCGSGGVEGLADAASRALAAIGEQGEA